MAEVMDAPRLPSHIYIHVPFCPSRCSYCDFFSIGDPPTDMVAAVFGGMESQLSQWGRSGLSGVVDTVYVGGGTPSAYPAPVASLLHEIRELFVVHPTAEVTVEANPDSFGDMVARVLSEAGTSRISIGIQSFDDSLLRLLGRRHDASQAEAACAAAVDAGLELAVDLICGIPGQDMDVLVRDVERAVATGASHVSVYPLALEEGTELALGVSAGLVAEPDPDESAEMMVVAAQVLAAAGFVRYEVASHARAGHESRHNIAYWTGRSYLGIGPGAHAMFDPPTARGIGIIAHDDTDVARVRYTNASDIEEWLLARGDRIETLNASETAREDVMLGMRLVRGVPRRQAESAGVDGVLTELADLGLVELVDARWRTTERGWLLGNEVFGRIWTGE